MKLNNAAALKKINRALYIERISRNDNIINKYAHQYRLSMKVARQDVFQMANELSDIMMSSINSEKVLIQSVMNLSFKRDYSEYYHQGRCKK